MCAFSSLAACVLEHRETKCKLLGNALTSQVAEARIPSPKNKRTISMSLDSANELQLNFGCHPVTHTFDGFCFTHSYFMPFSLDK